MTTEQKEKLKSADLKEQEAALKDTSALKLPEAVGQKYTVRPGTARIFHDTATGSLVDLNRIDVKRAEKLASRGILDPKV
jgi:hypothetical protein